MNNLDQIPPEPNLHTTLKQPRPRLHAVISANFKLHAPANDRRPVPGPSVADVDGGRLVDITVEGDSKYFALMAGNIISVKTDITAKGQSNNAEYEKGGLSYLRSPRPIETGLNRRRGTSPAIAVSIGYMGEDITRGVLGWHEGQKKLVYKEEYLLGPL